MRAAQRVSIGAQATLNALATFPQARVRDSLLEGTNRARIEPDSRAYATSSPVDSQNNLSSACSALAPKSFDKFASRVSERMLVSTAVSRLPASCA